MRLSPVKVAWPRLYLAIGKAWGEQVAPTEKETIDLAARAEFRIQWWVNARDGKMDLSLPREVQYLCDVNKKTTGKETHFTNSVGRYSSLHRALS
jgi:hypothetical protein